MMPPPKLKNKRISKTTNRMFRKFGSTRSASVNSEDESTNQKRKQEEFGMMQINKIKTQECIIRQF